MGGPDWPSSSNQPEWSANTVTAPAVAGPRNRIADLQNGHRLKIVGANRRQLSLEEQRRAVRSDLRNGPEGGHARRTGGPPDEERKVPIADVGRPRSKSRKPPLIRSALWAIPVIVARLLTRAHDPQQSSRPVARSGIRPFRMDLLQSCGAAKSFDLTLATMCWFAEWVGPGGVSR